MKKGKITIELFDRDALKYATLFKALEKVLFEAGNEKDATSLKELREKL